MGKPNTHIIPEKRMSDRDVFLFFFRAYPVITLQVIALLVLAGFAEAIGISAFLPFIQIVLQGGEQISDIPVLQDVFQFLNIPVNFYTLSIFIGSALLFKAVILWLAMRQISNAVALIGADLRFRLMHALMHAKWRYFVENTLGSSLNAVSMETLRSSRAFVTLTAFFSSIVQVFTYLIAAFFVSWKICLFGILVGGVLGFTLRFLIKTSNNAGRVQTNVTKVMLSQMADIINGIKPLRAMALETKFLGFLQDYSKTLQNAEQQQLLSAQSMSIFQEPLMVVSALIGLAVIITIGGLNGSEIALMGVLFIRMMTGFNKAQSQYQKYAYEETALESLLYTIHNAEGSKQEWDGQKSVPEKSNTITFDQLNFMYQDVPILDKLTIKISPYKITVLSGPSGSGKTTIIDLLCGFYRPDSGSILVNKTPLQDLDLREWRHNLGFVPQDVFLLNASVRDNILMGRDSEYTDQDIWESLEAAEASDFIKALDAGLDSPAGEGGRMFSGGQRQRLAIARAILHKPQILLLDEATSALDFSTEKQVLETLKKLSKRMTVVFSSHNQAVLDYADHIIDLTK